MKQTTILHPVELTGIGLHKGIKVKLRLEPLEDNRGIEFFRSDVDVTIKLNKSNVIGTNMATIIGSNGYHISTIEHLLSAVSSYGIDNLKIIVDADEIPIFDGSSFDYCKLLDEAGIVELESPKKTLIIKNDIIIQDGIKFVKVSPSKNLNYNFEIDFNHSAIGKQILSFTFSKSKFKDEISKARTFGFLKDAQYLHSKGLALGGSLKNAIILNDDGVMNEEGLRFKDEFVRHKILDAIGDMSLLGYNFVGSYESFAGSHSLNFQLVQAILEDSDNFEVVEL